MIDGSEKRNRHLAFELQNSHVCEKRSKHLRLSSRRKVVIGLCVTRIFSKVVVYVR